MRPATLSKKLPPLTALLAVSFCLGACFGCAEPRVSPWENAGKVTLSAFVEKPNLDDKLATIDRETSSLGLALADELTVKLGPSDVAVVRAYEGRDAAKRRVFAVRVATPRAVTLAVGPLDVGDVDRSKPTRLVPLIVRADDGSAHRSGSDLNGDGAPDLVLANELGELTVMYMSAYSCNAYEVIMAAPPTAMIDADGDKKLDLFGALRVDRADPIAPVLSDVGVLDGLGYSNRAPGARAWHAQKARAIDERSVPANEREEAKLARAIERAWHMVLAGEAPDRAIAALGKLTPSKALEASFERHRLRVASLTR